MYFQAISASCSGRRLSASVDIDSQRYLVYLKYWTLNLRPLMVYPKVLYIQTLSSGECEGANLVVLDQDPADVRRHYVHKHEDHPASERLHSISQPQRLHGTACKLCQPVLGLARSKGSLPLQGWPPQIMTPKTASFAASCSVGRRTSSTLSHGQCWRRSALKRWKWLHSR